MTDPTPVTADTLPEGNYAIVEALGHRTLVGRIGEVECFGTKMLQIEPLAADLMLGPVLIGGGSIYMMTPCSAAVAWKRRPARGYSLPSPIAAIMPPGSDGEDRPPFFHGSIDDEDEDLEL